MQDPSENEQAEPRGLIPSLVAPFMDGKLSILLIGLALVLGLAAILGTPREEEPQIVVPMADVLVEFPGATAKDVERRVTSPMEKLIWEIPGVAVKFRGVDGTEAGVAETSLDAAPSPMALLALTT